MKKKNPAYLADSVGIGFAADSVGIGLTADSVGIGFAADSVGIGLTADSVGIGLTADSVGIGDGNNDKEIIQAAGLGVAMGNARDSFKGGWEGVIWEKKTPKTARSLI